MKERQSVTMMFMLTNTTACGIQSCNRRYLRGDHPPQIDPQCQLLQIFLQALLPGGRETSRAAHGALHGFENSGCPNLENIRGIVEETETNYPEAG